MCYLLNLCNALNSALQVVLTLHKILGVQVGVRKGQ